MNIIELVKKPRLIIYKIGIKGWIKGFDDETYLKLMYWAKMGKKLDLKNPVTFNEKLQWLKLHNQNPEYSKMVDKYEAKKWVSERIGDEYIIPTLGVWNSFDEIDFTQLPNQFVFNKAKTKKKIEASLKRNYFLVGREYPYKAVKPRIIAEKYMVDSNSKEKEECLTDYKFFCFDGQPKIVYVGKDKSEDPRTDFFNMNFEHLPIRMRDPNADVVPEKPVMFEKMKSLAGILSKGCPHLRVDFYLINNQIYVGELTFYHCSGFTEVKPDEWNNIMGSWIDLD